MRLLAYGGVSYVERRRIGTWPETPPDGALGDPYGLTGEGFAFGVGLLKDRKPFLILRQRQNLQNRGGYAYTLLLDPGDEVWGREGVSWNGARLILSLLADSEALDRLLLKPEEVTEQALENLLRNLRPADYKACPHDTARLRSLWVGSLLGATPLVAAPSDVGFDERPALECVAEALDLLPVLFRCGHGWLVGGSEEHAGAFGARLAIDEGAAAEGEQVSKLVKRGKKFLSDWKIIDESDPDWEQKFRIPAWKLESIGYNSVEKLFNVTRKRAESLIFSREGDASPPKKIGDLIADLNDTEGERTAEEKKTFQIALRGILAGATSRKMPIATRFLLEQHFKGEPVGFKEGDDALLNTRTLVRVFAKERAYPSFDSCKIPLGWASRYLVWRRLMVVAEAGEGIPPLLSAAVSDLDCDPVGDGDPLRTDEKRKIRKLIGDAVKLTLIKSNSLLMWLGWGYEAEEVESCLAARLRSEAARRARTREGNSWPLEYVSFGGDPGGQRLADAGARAGADFGPAEAKTLVESALAAAQGVGPLAEKSKQWLARLVESPFRRLVPLETKNQIARTLPGVWETFHEMWQLYHGQKGAAELAGAITEDERARLREELHELVKPGGPPGARAMNRTTPNLRGLVELLGSIPEADLTELSGRQPELTSWEGAQGWLGGWLALGRQHDAVYQSELVRFATRHAGALPADFPLERLDGEGLRRMLAHYLSGEDDDESCRARVRAVFERRPEDEQLDRALAAALDEVGRAGPRTEVFVRRFAGRRRVPDVLFAHLDGEAQRRWVSLMAAAGRKKFLEEAHTLYASAVEEGHRTGARPRPYARAIFEFMRSAEGAEVKSQVATWYHRDIFSSDTIDRNLGELLDEVSPAAETCPASEPSPSVFKRLARKIFRRKDDAGEQEKTAGSSADDPAAANADAVTAPGSAAGDGAAGKSAPPAGDEGGATADAGASPRAEGEMSDDPDGRAREAAAANSPAEGDRRAEVKSIGHRFSFTRKKAGTAPDKDNPQ